MTKTEDTHGGRIARARDDFLSGRAARPPVRPLIHDSWRRSADSGVDPGTLTASFQDEQPIDPKVLAAVDTVFGRCARDLEQEDVSLLFATPSGQVLRRSRCDRGLARALGRVGLEPGADYAERQVGTNGIGTALEMRAPALVVGAEHYSEELTPFACAGAPVRHPVLGTLLGVVDLTCLADRGNAFMLSTARMIAGRIEEEVLAQVGARELALLRDYLTTCRTAAGPVVAVKDDLVMMNRFAQQRLDGPDRGIVLARAGEVTGQREPTTLVTDLPSGATARMTYRPTFVGDDVAGGVVQVKIGDARRSTHTDGGAPALPGLVGAGVEWARTVSALRDAQHARRWVVLEGEAGVGKSSLVRSVHHLQDPTGEVSFLDADTAAADGPERWLAEVEERIASRAGTLVLRHLDRLPDDLMGPLSGVLVAASDLDAERTWVVATRDVAHPRPDLDAVIVPTFDRTICLDPLRHRPDDIRVMVPALIRRLARSADLTVSPQALSHLVRHPWPGNATQLTRVLRTIVAQKRSGVVDIADLPPECMSVGRRVLTPLERLERDAITQALRDTGGNKALAAEHLGMSRATIYRKIGRYDIVVE